MRGVIASLTKTFQQLSDEKVLTLARVVELEKNASVEGSNWRNVLAALRPRLSELRPPRAPTVQRRFYQPIEDFLINKRLDGKRAGQIARSSLTPIWDWIKQSDLHADIEQASNILGHSMMPQDELEQLVAPIRQDCYKMMSAIFEECRTNSKIAREMKAAVGGPEVFEDFKEIVLAITVDQQLLAMQRELPPAMKTVTTSHINFARNYFDEFDLVNPEASYLIPFVFLSRLTQPWEVLRLTEAVSRLRTEELLMSTEFRLVCEHLIAMLHRNEQAFIESGPEDIEAFMDYLQSYTDMYGGISQVVEVKKQSELGQILLNSRNHISSHIGKRVQEASETILEALPKNYGPVIRSASREPIKEHVERMTEAKHRLENLSAFLLQVSRLSYSTNLYVGIDQEVKTLNRAVMDRVVALTLAYRQHGASSSALLDLYFDAMAPVVRKLSGTEAESQLQNVKLTTRVPR